MFIKVQQMPRLTSYNNESFLGGDSLDCDFTKV